MSYWECLQVSEILCLYNCHRVIRPCILQGLSFQWALLLQSFPLHFLCFFTLFLSFKSSWHWQLIFKSHLIIAMATVGCSKFWTNAGIVQLSAFPSLRGTTCFYLAQKMKGKPRAAESGRRFSTFCWAGQISQVLQGREVGSQVTQPTEPLYPHTIAMFMS